MSDMKTFTVRDLDRRPSEVLEACDVDGEARIQTRDGRTYLLKPDTSKLAMIVALPDFEQRRATLFRKPLTKEFAQKFDRALASE